MPTSSTLLAVGLLTIVLFAGCAGGSAKTDSPPAPPGSEIKATGSPIEGTSTVDGVVIDEQTLPLAGVSIAVRSASLGTTLHATTDDAGSFAVTSIIAGEYHVFAAKLGYSSATKAVSVEEGDTATVTMTLSAIVIEQIFHETIGPYVGFVTCAYTRPGVSGVTGAITYNCPSQAGAALGESVNEFEFELKQENMQSIVGELRWTPGAVGTSQRLSLFLMPEDGGGSNWYCTNGGTSPVTMIYHEDEEKDLCSQRGSRPDPKVPEMDTPLIFTVYLPFDSINPNALDKSSPPNVVFQQKYESIATVFYGKDPEREFSAFIDA